MEKETKKRPTYSDEERFRIYDLFIEDKYTSHAITEIINQEFFDGAPVRNERSINGMWTDSNLFYKMMTQYKDMQKMDQPIGDQGGFDLKVPEIKNASTMVTLNLSVNLTGEFEKDAEIIRDLFGYLPAKVAELIKQKTGNYYQVEGTVK